jgi:hypothetical protein
MIAAGRKGKWAMKHPSPSSLPGAILLLAGLLSVHCGIREADPIAVDSGSARMTVLGPGGGGSTFIPTFHPVDPGRILLRCDMGGAYLSLDQGESWRMLNFAGGTRSFAFDATDAQTIYVGAAALHATRDGGRTWAQLFPDPERVSRVHHSGDHASPWFETTDNFPDGPGNSVGSILVDSRDLRHVLAGVSGRSGDQRFFGLFSSRDAGASWSLVTELEGPILKMFETPEPSRRVLVFLRDARLALDPVNDSVIQPSVRYPETPGSLTSIDVGVDPASGALVLWAVGGRSPGEFGDGGIYRSGDEGVSWDEVSPVPKGGLEAQRAVSFSGVATSAQDARTVYATCDRWMEENSRGERGHWYGVLKTVDAGKTWNWVYRAGGGSSDYTRRDGVEAENLRDSWVREAFAGEYIRVLDAGVHAANPDVAIFTDWYRAMLTTDGGASWKALYSETLADGSVRSRGLDVTTSYGVHFDPFDDSHIAVSYTDIGYFHSYDRGRTWRRSVEGVPPAWDNTCYWMQFDPEVKDRVWSAWSSWHDIPRMKMIRMPDWSRRAVGGICRSDDGGRTWEVTSRGLPENAPSTSIVLDPTSAKERRVLYAAVYGQGVFKSVDGGSGWELKNNGLRSNLNAWELTLALDGTLYLIISQNTRFEGQRVLSDLMPGEVYRSRDGGESWERISLPPGVRYPNSLSIDPTRPDRLYLACWAGIGAGDYGAPGDADQSGTVLGGVWRSDDGGSGWRSVFDTSTYVYGVMVDPRRVDRVFVNTFQRGAYFSDDGGATWSALAGYDFSWGHRAVPDPLDPEMIYLTTFGGSLFHGSIRAARPAE